MFLRVTPCRGSSFDHLSLSIFLLSFLRRTFGENRFSSLTSFPFLLYTRALSHSLLLPFSILLTLSFFFDRKEKSYTLKPRATKFRREKGEKFFKLFHKFTRTHEFSSRPLQLCLLETLSRKLRAARRKGPKPGQSSLAQRQAE